MADINELFGSQQKHADSDDNNDNYGINELFSTNSDKSQDTPARKWKIRGKRFVKGTVMAVVIASATSIILSLLEQRQLNTHEMAFIAGISGMAASDYIFNNENIPKKIPKS